MIEHVAFQSFAIAGYDATSIRAVAARANIDPALISRRYGSKLGLWLATVDDVAASLKAVYRVMLEEMAGDGPFETRFRNALRHFVAFNCDMPELPNFFLNELQLTGGRRDYVTTAIWEPYLEVMQGLFDEANKHGMCRLNDRALAPASFLGLVVMPHLVAPALGAELAGDEASLVDRIMSSVDAVLIGD
jgi:TetR/AcrR family transcriptional regulator